MKAHRALALAASTAVTFSVIAAELDPVVVEVAAGSPRWVQAEVPPAGHMWTSVGAQQTRDGRVVLAAGESVQVLIPAAAAIEIHAERPIGHGETAVYCGDGNGLARRLDLGRILSADGRRFALAPSTRGRLLRIEATARMATELRLRIELRRVLQTGFTRGYRIIDLPGEIAIDQQDAFTEWERGRAAVLEAWSPLVLAIEGPMHLRLGTRLAYQATVTDRRQSGVIVATIDDGSPEIHELDFIAGGRPVRMAGSTVALSQPAYAFVDLGPGRHELKLESTRDVVITLEQARLMEPLLGLNRVAPEPAEIWRRQADSSTGPGLELLDLLQDLRWYARRPGAPGRAFASRTALETIAESSLELPQIASFSRLVAGRTLFFRDLEPKAPRSHLTRRAYHRRTIDAPAASAADLDLNPVALAAPLADGLAASLPSATFAPLEAGETLEFVVPPQPATVARVAVVGGPERTESLVLTSDCSEPEELLLHPLLVASAEMTRSSLAAFAHALEHERFGEAGAPFRLSPPLPTGRAASLEIELGPGCGQLSLSRSGGDAPLEVAVSVLAERERALPEQEVLGLVAAAERGDALGAQARRRLEELEDQWRTSELDALAAEQDLVGDGPLPWRLDDRDEQVAAPESADPLIDLERLTEELRTRGGGWRHVERVVQALDRLGEWHLADGLLRAVASTAPSHSMRRKAARARLDRRRESQLDGLSAALALNRIRQEDGAGRAQVTAELLAAGRSSDALRQSVRALPEDRRLTRWMADALGWWELAPDVEALADWRAAAWLDREPPELTLPGRGGVANGLDIHRRLRDHDPAVRARAVLDWETSARDPAEPVWRRLDRRAVTTDAGGLLFRSRRTGRVGRRWLATPERPVELQVGPGSVRLELRALVDAGQGRADSRWVRATTCGLTRPLLMPGGPVSSSLEVLGRAGEGLSVSHTATLEMPPGCWQLRLQTEAGVVAVGVERLEPDRFSVLPTFEPEHATRVLLPPPTAPADLPGRPVLVAPAARSATSNLPGPDGRAQGDDGGDEAETDRPTFVQPILHGELSTHHYTLGLDAATAARIGLRLGLAEVSGWPGAVAAATGNGPELVVATAMWQGPDTACDHESQDPDAAPLIALACLSDERIDRALLTLSAAIARTDDAGRSELAHRRLELVLFAAHTGLMPRDAALVEAAATVHDNPGDRRLAELAEHVLDDTSWRRLAPSLSAGLRLVEVPGWQRSTAPMRARLALLGRPPTAERLLRGSESISLEIGNLSPSTSRLELEAIGLWMFRAQPMTAVWRLRDLDSDNALLDEKHVVLSPGRKESVLIEVPAGRTLLQVELADPPPNHVAAVRLHEHGESGRDRQELLEDAFARRLRFDVATPEQPIVVEVEGPAWLREDRLRDSELHRRFHRLEAGPQTFRIESEGEGLVRLWRLEAEPRTASQEPPQLAQAEPQATPQPEEVPAIPGRVVAEALIKGSANATWEVSAFWRHLRSFEEDDVDDDAEEHLETRVERRSFITPRHHRESVALARLHEGTDLVLGLADVHRMMVSGWRLRLSARGFAQTPVGRDVVVGSPWWSIDGRAELGRRFYLNPRLFHRPSLAAGARFLSLDEDEAAAIGSIDNDVWTPYKADHRFALRLNERIEIRARDDLRLWARLSVTSNEEPTGDGIDNARVAVGAHQMIGDLEARAFVALSTYFADSDRSSQVTRPLLGVDLTLDRWVLDGHRITAGLRWRHEIDSGRDSIAAGLTWVFEKGLGWRNEAPGSEPFRSRKRRRAAERSAVGGFP